MGFVAIFNRGLGQICGWWMVVWFERVGKLFLAECLLVPYSGYRFRVYEPFNVQLSCINQNTYRVKNEITFFEFSMYVIPMPTRLQFHCMLTTEMPTI